MKTETIQVMSKGKVVAEVEIERFTNVDPPDEIWSTISEFFGSEAEVLDWLNKVYEAEVVRRTRKLATAPKVSKELFLEVELLMEGYINYLLERRLNVPPFMRRIEHLHENG